MRRVKREFFAQPTLVAARRLLGMELVHETAAGVAAGRIVEVEAYMGPGDRAAHSYGGRRTERVRAMWGAPGHAYIYFIYGMHWCCNVVTGPEGVPESVLVRALEPTEGLPLMARRRGLAWPEGGSAPTTAYLRQLTSGPARLCQALAITGEQYGWDLVDSPLYLRHATAPVAADQIEAGPRIGIDYAGPDRDHPWRFWVQGSRHVSR